MHSNFLLLAKINIEYKCQINNHNCYNVIWVFKKMESVMIRISKYLLVLVTLLGVLQGCVSNDQREANVVSSFQNRSDDFGAFPTQYKSTIKREFNKIADVHHPEHLDYMMRRPVKFYQFSLDGTEVQWYGWVAEVAIPDKAVYLFGESESTNWRTYYVRFTGNHISHVYGGEDYTWLKKFQGYELIEDEQLKLVQAKFRGAEAIGTSFVKFRHDLPALPSDSPETELDIKLLSAVQKNNISDAMNLEALGADPRRVQTQLCRTVPKYSSTVNYLYRWCGEKATGFIPAVQSAARQSNLSMLRSLYAAGVSPNKEVVWENPMGFDRAFPIGCFGLFNKNRQLLHDALNAGFNPYSECWGDPIIERIVGQREHCQSNECRSIYTGLAQELAVFGVVPKEEASWIDFDTVMKLAVTAGTGTMVASSDIDAAHGTEIFAATMKDLWLDDGGNNLAELNKRYQQGDFSVQDPSLAEMLKQQTHLEHLRQNAVKDLHYQQQLHKNKESQLQSLKKQPQVEVKQAPLVAQQKPRTTSNKATLSKPVQNESLELQQMREVLKQFDEVGVAPPAELVKLFEKMKKEELKNPKAKNDNPYGKNLSEMTCVDDISGVWKTDSGLTTFDIQNNGKVKMLSKDATGQYYTEGALNWSATATKFSVSYHYLRTYDSQTNKLQYESKPKDETVSCKYMGTMLNIGGKLYRR